MTDYESLLFHYESVTDKAHANTELNESAPRVKLYFRSATEDSGFRIAATDSLTQHKIDVNRPTKTLKPPA